MTFFQSHIRVSCICQKPDQATVLYQVRSMYHLSMSKFSSSSLQNVKITIITMKNKIMLHFSASFSYIPASCAHTGFR